MLQSTLTVTSLLIFILVCESTAQSSKFPCFCVSYVLFKDMLMVRLNSPKLAHPRVRKIGRQYLNCTNMLFLMICFYHIICQDVRSWQVV